MILIFFLLNNFVLYGMQSNECYPMSILSKAIDQEQPFYISQQYKHYKKLNMNEQEAFLKKIDCNVLSEKLLVKKTVMAHLFNEIKQHEKKQRMLNLLSTLSLSINFLYFVYNFTDSELALSNSIIPTFFTAGSIIKTCSSYYSLHQLKNSQIPFKTIETYVKFFQKEKEGFEKMNQEPKIMLELA